MSESSHRSIGRNCAALSFYVDVDTGGVALKAGRIAAVFRSIDTAIAQPDQNIFQ
jgi:hypothetical protein